MPTGKLITDGTSLRKVSETLPETRHRVTLTEMQEVWHVNGLEQNRDERARLFRALDFVPAIDTRHPINPSMFVRELQPERSSAGAEVFVRVTYRTDPVEALTGNREPDPPNPNELDRRLEIIFSLDTGAISTQATRDLDGTIIVTYKRGNAQVPRGIPASFGTVNYRNPRNTRPGDRTWKPSDLEAGAEHQSGTVNHSRGSQRLSVVATGSTRALRAFLPDANFPLQTSTRLLTNVINDAPWRDGLAYEWRVTRASLSGIGLARTLSLEFEHDFLTHLPFAVYIDEQTGRPPADITDPRALPAARGNGTYLANTHRVADFSRVFPFIPTEPDDLEPIRIKI